MASDLQKIRSHLLLQVVEGGPTSAHRLWPLWPFPLHHGAHAGARGSRGLGGWGTHLGGSTKDRFSMEETQKYGWNETHLVYEICWNMLIYILCILYVGFHLHFVDQLPFSWTTFRRPWCFVDVGGVGWNGVITSMALFFIGHATLLYVLLSFALMGHATVLYLLLNFALMGHATHPSVTQYVFMWCWRSSLQSPDPKRFLEELEALLWPKDS